MRVLLTGPTGLLGSSLLGRLLRRGHHVLATARGRGQLAARTRLERTLRAQGLSPSQHDLQVFDLDAGSDLGDWIRRLQPIEAVIHTAAAVKFRSSEEDLKRQNVEATEELLRVLDRCAPTAHFHFVSTAYICGDRTGTCREEEGRAGQSFRQPYEESKLLAEECVVESCFRARRLWTIYRPSIIAGHSRTGAAANFNGLSFFLKSLDLLYRRCRSFQYKRPGTLVLPCDPEATKNIVPVDWVADAITELLSCGCPERVYHLTHPDPIPHQELIGIMQQTLGITALEARHPDESPEVDPYVTRSLGSFFPYLSGEPIFDRANLVEVLGPRAKPPAVDSEYIRRLVAFGRNVGWKSNPLEDAGATGAVVSVKGTQ